MIKIDSPLEIGIAGTILLAALCLLLLFLRWFLGRGGRLKGKDGEIGMGAASAEPAAPAAAPACAPYVAEHTAILTRIEKKLEDMDEARMAARQGAAESNKAMLKMVKQLAYSQDAVIDAMQDANFGNGNLKKAREALAECGDVRDGFLIDQLMVAGG
jgi:hypothetical protein